MLCMKGVCCQSVYPRHSSQACPRNFCGMPRRDIDEWFVSKAGFPHWVCGSTRRKRPGESGHTVRGLYDAK